MTHFPARIRAYLESSSRQLPFLIEILALLTEPAYNHETDESQHNYPAVWSTRKSNHDGTIKRSTIENKVPEHFSGDLCHQGPVTSIAGNDAFIPGDDDKTYL